MSSPPDDLATSLSSLLAAGPGRRAAHLAALGAPSEVLPLLAEEASRWTVTDLEAALSASACLVALSDELADHRARAATRRARAQALACASRHADALEVATEAIALALDGGAPVEAARARLAMAQVLDRQGRAEESIAMGERARGELLAAGETGLAARADVNLGIAHRLRNDPQTALEHFSRARVALADDPVIAAQIDSNRAEAHLDLNEFAEAERLFASALAGFEASGVTRAATIVEGNLADLMSRQGRLSQALSRFERARRHFETDDRDADEARRARLQAEQAEAFARSGLVHEALERYLRAVPLLDRYELTAEAARARVGLGQAMHAVGRDEEADATLSAAAAVFERLGHDAGAARVRLALGAVAAARGDRARAARVLTEALALVGDRPAEAAVARHHLARVALANGDLPEAESLIDAALAVARELDLAPLLADLLHARAMLRRAQGRGPEALADLRAAADTVERLRGTLQGESLRSAFVGDRGAVYEDLVTALLEAGPEAADEALEAVERAKSRVLLDLAAGALDPDALAEADDSSAGDSSADALVRDIARHRADLNALYSRLDDLAPGRGDPDGRWRRRVEATERALRTLESRVAATRVLGGVLAPPLAAPELRAQLDRETAIIEYFVAGGTLAAFVVRSDRPATAARLGPIAAVEESIERWHFQVGRAIAWSAGAPGTEAALVADAQRELARLAGQLVDPLATRLEDVTRLVIVPHGPLHGVPFHALHTSGAYLLERFEISYAPSASLLRYLEASGPARVARGRPVVVVGVADEAAPRIEEEARSIASTLGANRVLLGDAATVAAVRRAASGAGVLHLACHARFAPAAPLASGLKLADGWMTVRDLYTLDLDGAVVVLSGCDTGRSAIGGGDEPTGLVRGLLAAGASAVVMSLWLVNDESAEKSMAAFYRAWYKCLEGSQAGHHLAAAMRTAQQEMMARRAHPVFWGPFIYLGRPACSD